VKCRALGCLLVLLLISGCFGGEDRAPPAREEPTAAAGPELGADTARELSDVLRETVEQTGVTGASAAVVFPDGGLWQDATGLAVVKPERPMTSETTLPFASISKPATAALAMRLVEAGRLGLDDPIRRWYPTWRGHRAATVRDLLGHTAGVGEPPNAYFEQLGDGRAPTARRFIAATAKPGPRTTSPEYSDTGFMIAGLILERAGREPIAAAMRRELFTHPGGDGIAFQPDERAHRPLAHSHSYVVGGGRPVDLADGSGLLPNRGVATMSFTAGALAGDVPSLARWGHELLGGRILEPESLRVMADFRDGSFWGGYGLGLARTEEGEHELWGHEGETIGAISALWHAPQEDVTVAVSMNDDLLSVTETRLVRNLLETALPPAS